MDVIELEINDYLISVDVTAPALPDVIEVHTGLKGDKGDPGTGGGNITSVNGKTGVVVLSATDVGAKASSYVPAWTEITGKPTIPTTAADVGAVPTTRTVNSKALSANIVLTTDDITDGTTNRLYTATEKTKLSGIATSATANSTDAQLRDRSTHTGTQSADTITDGTTNKAYTATEKTKLGGIATGATVNSTDATLLNRANHTGSQTSTTISDFTEAVQDAVGALLTSGTNVSLTYDDTNNSLVVNAVGGDAEVMRDTIGAALVAVGNIGIAVNDAADTITISTTATVNATDAALRDRSTHTGTQSADTITDGTTNKAFLATERTKLTGIATGATANSTDTFLLSRANHTGTQAISTITSLQTSLDAKAAIADLYGTGANQWGIRPTLYWTGTAWPTRTVPAGYTGPVIWDSSTDVAATAPSTANTNDLWDQYVG